MNNRRSLPMLFVLFVVLAVAAVLTSQKPETPPDTSLQVTVEVTEEATELPQGNLLRVFPDLAVLDIQAIRLQDLETDQELTLVRDAQGQWTAPDLNGELDAEAVSSLARTLVLFPYARSINIVSDTRFEDYGLAPRPQILIQILLVDGGTHVIAIGHLSEAGYSYYTLVDERDEIFQIERGAVDFLKNLIASPRVHFKLGAKS
ncbi:MAG: hypothetical protein K8J31_08660 [Anaerolineae bacterium]|nr:hypothetical protein [Anaerolineae bacterium]